MADLPSYPDSGDDRGADPDHGSATSRPWWVYAIWILGIVLVVLFVALHLTGAVGPGGH